LENKLKTLEVMVILPATSEICAKAVSTVLRIPIILITAIAGVPTIPFVPHNGFASTDPIYMAYNHSGPGHYDATKGQIQI